MSASSSTPGFSIGIAVHAIALGALLVFGGEEIAVSNSAADPILLMLGGDDPNKDAGLVGRDRGVARGTEDGNLFDPGEFSQDRLNALTEQNQRLAAEEAAAAERARQAAEEAARRAEAEKAAAEKAARERAAREKAKETGAKPKPAPNNNSKGKGDSKASGAEKVDISKLLKDRNRSGGNKPGNTRKPSGNGSGKRISDVRVGGGGGQVFGRPDGTGGNGGDGGKRVADEQMLYVEAVLQRFKIHFENVVAQNPVSIPDSVTIDARFSVDSSGNIRFLEVLGSSDPQIRDRVRKTFERAFPSRFQRPPRGDAFTGCLRGITFSVN